MVFPRIAETADRVGPFLKIDFWLETASFRAREMTVQPQQKRLFDSEKGRPDLGFAIDGAWILRVVEPAGLLKARACRPNPGISQRDAGRFTGGVRCGGDDIWRAPQNRPKNRLRREGAVQARGGLGMSAWIWILLWLVVAPVGAGAKALQPPEASNNRSQLLLSAQCRATLTRVSGPVWDVYGEADPPFLNGALQFLEAFSKVAQRAFGLEKLPVGGEIRPAAVFLKDKPAYLSEGLPGESRGYYIYRYNGGKKLTHLLFVTYREPGRSWEEFPKFNLQHECTHLILRRQLSWGNVPAGIDEGMAMVMERWNVQATPAQNLDIFLRKTVASGLFEARSDDIEPVADLLLKKAEDWYQQPRYQSGAGRERAYETAGLWVWYLFTSPNGVKFYRSGILPAIVPDGGAALDLSSRAYKTCEAEFPLWIGQQLQRVRAAQTR